MKCLNINVDAIGMPGVFSYDVEDNLSEYSIEVEEKEDCPVSRMSYLSGRKERMGTFTE